MELDKRQKVIFGLVAVAVIILIWQLYSLFGGGSSPSVSTVVSSKTQTITSLKEAASPTEVIQSSRSPVNAKTVSAQPVVKLSSEDAQTQQEYLALVNQYQLVEIQRLIAQDQAAIAAARAATAASLAKMGMSGGDAASSLASSIVSAGNQSGDYELIYTGQDNGEWSATLKRNGQFNDVTAGSVLPDGDKVLSVDDNGVTIQEGDLKKLVTFNGVSPINDKVQAEQPKAAALQTQLQPAPAAKPAKEAQVETKKVVLPAPLPVPLPKVVATNAPAADVSSEVINGFDISKANKTSYTLQIVSDDNAASVKAFITENHLSGKAQVVKILRNKKPWYIAVIGEYANSSAANKAIAALPDAIQDEEPFPRRIEAVQSEMVK